MAIQPKHGDRQGRMDFENDFTTEQSHRFTAVANSAFKRRVKNARLKRRLCSRPSKLPLNR